MNHSVSVRLVSALAVIVVLCSYFIGCEAFPPNARPSDPAQPSGPTPSPVQSNGKTIVIDAGHGAPDGGATGKSTGVIESTLNLKVAYLLKAELEMLGYNVVMTRTDDNALAEKKRADMAERLRIMNGSSTDMVVSVHMNEFTDSAVNGPMVFYHKNSPEAQKLAKFVIDGLCDSVGRPRRHANSGNYYVIRESTPVAIIAECGFLSNPEEEVRLQDAAYQNLLAKGIAAGIQAYFMSLASPSPTDMQDLSNPNGTPSVSPNTSPAA